MRDIKNDKTTYSLFEELEKHEWKGFNGALRIIKNEFPSVDIWRCSKILLSPVSRD